MNTSRYEFDALLSAQSFATLTIRKTTLVNVCLRFVIQSLVERMIVVIPTDIWDLSSVNSHYIPRKISDMYKYIAVTILFQGYQGNVTSIKTGKWGQIVGVKMAWEHFNNFPQKIWGVSLVDAAMSRLLISSDMEEELSINYLLSKWLTDYWENIGKPGHWVGMYNTEHQECFVYSSTWASSSEKKFVTWNCNVERAKASREAGTSNISLYDLYASSYGFWDKFNKSLAGCMYPYKRGGKSCPGYTRIISDFYLTCTLKNNFAVYQELSAEVSPKLNFCDMCLQLANQLYDHSCSLNI